MAVRSKNVNTTSNLKLYVYARVTQLSQTATFESFRIMIRVLRPFVSIASLIFEKSETRDTKDAVQIEYLSWLRFVDTVR